MSNTSHERLIIFQSTDELERKSIKSRRRGYFTQENIDFAHRYGSELSAKLRAFNDDLPVILNLEE